MSAQLGIGWKEWSAHIQILKLQQYVLARVVQGGFPRNISYIFHENRAFITTPVIMAQCGNESTGVDFQQRLRFLIRIHLNVLVWDALQFERDPYPLHKWTSDSES